MRILLIGGLNHGESVFFDPPLETIHVPAGMILGKQYPEYKTEAYRLTRWRHPDRNSWDEWLVYVHSGMTDDAAQPYLAELADQGRVPPLSLQASNQPDQP